MAKAGAAISARDFKFGLCCGMFLDASLPELIDIAARHGFPTITARPLAVAAALDAGLTERTLRRLLADAGIRVTMVDALSTGLPGAVSPDTFDPALRAVIPVDSLNPPDEETCLRSAEVLEAPYVNVSLFRAQRVPMAEMDRPRPAHPTLATFICTPVYSFDAYVLIGTRVDPDTAYRFARGEAIDFLGQTVRRREPLDFLAVTDHAENIGVFNELEDPDCVVSKSEYGKPLGAAPA